MYREEAGIAYIEGGGTYVCIMNDAYVKKCGYTTCTVHTLKRM